MSLLSATQTYHLLNARLPGRAGLFQLDIVRGKIAAIAPMSESPSLEFSTLDVAGDWISLGGVDLQINGGLGLAFPDLEAHHLPQIRAISEYLWQQGVDAYLPTIVTTAVDKIHNALAAIACAMIENNRPNTARILGVHLEGPFLNPHKRGAHPQEHLLPLTRETVDRVLGDYASVVKVITLAPELDETESLIPELTARGIVVSLGHSLATAAQSDRAFAQGATMVTHAFNAMPGLHHRQPGLLGAALIHPDVWCGLIADGQHVCPTMLQLVLRAGLGAKGIFLVSDALAPIGLGDGVYPWDTRSITVSEGTARLADGTLSGTTLPLLVGVENLVKWGICEVGEAIALATESPRRAIGLRPLAKPIALAGLAPGEDASLLRWHREPSGHLTWERIGGKEHE